MTDLGDTVPASESNTVPASESDTVDALRWQHLLALDRTIDHWYWRPGWRIGRRFYTWHLTFEDTPEVQRLATLYQSKIDLPFLDPVPLDGLHLTLQGIGFTDEVGHDDLAAMSAAAQVRCAELAPMELRIGPADADEQGVPLALRPWEPLRELRAALRHAIADVWGSERVPDAAEGFHPHITVFYSNAIADPTPLRERLTELRDTPPVRATIRRVSLIELGRDDKVYRWSTVANVALTG
jgi:2'-5' RNA ligase